MARYIAFICGHNSGRSQMAQGAFNHLKKLFPSVDEKYEAISWGTDIGSDGKINPKVIGTMRTIGIDLTDKTKHYPKKIGHPYIQERLGSIVKAFTMGCMDAACELPDGMQIRSHDVGDWALDDPAKNETDVTALRNDILGRTLELILALNSRAISP